MKYDAIFVVSPSDNDGKSTFANALAAALDVKAGETSQCIDEPLVRYEAVSLGCGEQAARKFLLDCPGQRIRDRKRAFAKELCRVNPSWMVDECFASGARVIVGCRRPEEIMTWINRRVASQGTTYVKIFIVYRAESPEQVQPMTDILRLQIETEEVLNNGTVEQLIEVAKMEAAKLA